MPSAECQVKGADETLRFIRHSALGTRHSRRGLGLIALLTLVAMLMIGLAFVVSLARHVRSTSANELTRKRMQALADAFEGLVRQGVDATVPLPAGLLKGDPAGHEAAIQAFARASSRTLADRLASAAQAASSALAATSVVGGVPELHDAWGNSIALMPGQHAEVGMAPDDGPFLVSPGPDGRFLTLVDNLYSYDLPALLPKVRGRDTQPTTEP